MDYTDLRTLLDYHYWARDRMLDALDPLAPEQLTRDLGSSFKSVRDTAVHIYSADWVWYMRWLGRGPREMVPLDRFETVASLRAAWRDLEADIRAFVERLGPDGIAQVFEYRLFNGTEGRSVFWHMLQHVVNHGSYHRGQLTTMLRQLGAAPPKSLDLIAFHRERDARTA